MTTARVEINLKEGVRASLLLTPALYGVGKARGIDLSTAIASADDMVGVTRSYTRLAYCAAINAWEVDSVGDPDKGEFPYAYADFDAWGWERPGELMRLIDAFLLAFTGKGIKAYGKESLEQVKKKSRK